MRFVLLAIIRVYWKIYPIHIRRTCLFKDNCSNYIFRVTEENGFYNGIKALKERYSLCRPGYKIYKNEINNSFELCFKNGSFISEDKISPKLLPPLNYNYIIKK